MLAKSAATEPGSVRSAGTTSARDPMRPATRSSGSRRRPVSTVVKPAPASATATASPMPDPAPVTSAMPLPSAMAVPLRYVVVARRRSDQTRPRLPATMSAAPATVLGPGMSAQIA